MTGICIELKTECKFCGSPMPINALVDEILCHSCQKIQQFTFDYWRKTILDSAVTNGFKLAENEGQPQTSMTGEFTFHITFGKQQPRCGKCKTYLDDNKLDDFAKAGKADCEKCQNEISVRATPVLLKNIFQGMVFLVGEDSDMFSNVNVNKLTTQSSKPIIFTCPSCAGALEIDGKDRMVTCKFCSSEIYLPDDLWFRIHPVKTVNRWYMVYDDTFIKEKFMSWYEFSDCSIDEEGNVYMFTKGEDDDDCSAWSFNKEIKTRWSVVVKDFDDDETRMILGRDGALYIYDKSKQILQKLSCNDGSSLKVIKGNASPDDQHISFDIEQCDSMAIDDNGSIIGLINDHILRFTNNGENIAMWESDGSSVGLIGKLSGLFKNRGGNDDPDVTELKNKPLQINSYDTVVNIDWNENIYFLDTDTDENASLAKYDRNGNKLFNTKIPLYQKTSKPCFDKSGNVYVLGKDKNDLFSLIRYSQVDNSWKIIISDVTQGGYLSNEEKLAVAPDGTIYCLNYNNSLKIFDSGLNLVYISEKSKKDDAEKIAKYQKK